MSNVFTSFQGDRNYSPLRAAFGFIFQKVSDNPKSASALALTEFAAGVLLSRPFKNSNFADLIGRELSDICASIIRLCLVEGLSEPDRLSYAAAFEPYFALVESGARH